MKSSSQLFSVSLIRADVIETDLIKDTYLIKPDNSPDLTVKIAVTRLGSGSDVGAQRGTPVILMHGMYQNRSAWLPSNVDGLARLLLNAGYDPWLIDCRAHGDSPYNEQYKSNTYESCAQFDLPAVQQFVFEMTNQKALWVGNAEGGIAISASLAGGYLNQSDMSGLVLISTQVSKFPLSHRLPLSRLVSKLKLLFKTYAGDHRFGPEHESVGIIKEQIRWSSWISGWRPKKGSTYWKALKKISLPVIAITGAAEKRHSTKHCQKLLQAFGGATYLIELPNFNYLTLLSTQVGADEILLCLQKWLNANHNQ